VPAPLIGVAACATAAAPNPAKAAAVAIRARRCNEQFDFVADIASPLG
jgi:hypothetical protein